LKVFYNGEKSLFNCDKLCLTDMYVRYDLIWTEK